MNDLLKLEKQLGIEINDFAVFGKALTHSSYLNENDHIAADNERLEFLGDAVLDFVVGDYLFHRFPDVDEGELTSLRAALVKTGTLAGFARQLELGSFLRLGHGETESGGRKRNPILCAAFEAIVGATYLDQGLDETRKVLRPLLDPALEEIVANSLHKDAKSEFQVWAQAKFNITPRYVVISAEGPDHAKEFVMQAIVDETVWGEGRGSSKRRATQAAAAAAMEKALESERKSGL